MGKVTGLGMTLSVDDDAGNLQDISGDAPSFTVNTSRGEQDVTGIDKSAMERLLLLGDAEISISGVFNAALSHLVFRKIGTILAGQVGRTVTIAYPDAVTLSMEMVFSSYNINRGADGSLTWTATGKLADGTVPTFG
ncbi:MAG TPA: hypothetical protein VMW79_06150 [Anaerolineae bacterium]|nr:hypothetical protein [Anaerolineae bacterium]HUW95984.1 hypothetical protein [Anaerolineae bacterium]